MVSPLSSPLPALKLAHLRLVAAIAQHGQIQLAAQALMLTQPAASRTLAEIEKMVGGPLFERHPRGMAATPLGAIFVRRAHSMLMEMQDLAHELHQERAGLSGLVQAGAVTGPAVGSLVPAIRALKAASPHVELRIDVGPSIQLMRGLEEGDYDFIIGRLQPNSDAEAFQIVPGRIERVRCLVRRGHPLAGIRHVPLSALRNHPWIIQERGTPIRQAVEAAFIGKGLAVPADVVATSSLVLMMALITDSDMIAPMSMEVARLMEDTSGGVLAALDLDIPIEVAPYHLITRRDRRLSPAASRLYALALEEMTRQRD